MLKTMNVPKVNHDPELAATRLSGNVGSTEIIMKIVSKILLAVVVTTLAAGCGDSNKPTSKWVAAGTAKVNLPQAAFTGDAGAIKLAIAQGANLDEKSADQGNTPLMVAAVFGHTEAAEALIKGGANLNLQDNNGSTALIDAAFFCHADIVKALVKAGADKNLTNKWGATALQSVQAPFEAVQPAYDDLSPVLAQLGMKLDYDQLKADRPKIAKLLE